MIESKKLIQKIDARIESIQNEEKSQYSDDYKQYLSIEEAVYRRLKSELEFQILSPIDKQAKRIQQCVEKQVLIAIKSYKRYKFMIQ